ncbi:MAG TPA: response regulator transcription factor [Chloroflexota bacterium]
MEPLRLLLVDDHALFRDGLARLFAYEDDFQVVGEASDAEQAVTLAHSLQPDLVLMDVDMPRGGGIVATRRIKSALPATRVVMLTVHDDDDTLFQAIKAGAQGYLVKSIRAGEMLELLRGMAHGEAPLSRAMAARILEEFARAVPDAAGVEADAAETLTMREEEVLELVSQRCTNKEIAQRLMISEYTVKNHLSNILSKLHLRSRAEAARYAATQRRRPSES